MTKKQLAIAIGALTIACWPSASDAACRKVGAFTHCELSTPLNADLSVMTFGDLNDLINPQTQISLHWEETPDPNGGILTSCVLEIYATFNPDEPAAIYERLASVSLDSLHGSGIGGTRLFTLGNEALLIKQSALFIVGGQTARCLVSTWIAHSKRGDLLLRRLY